MEILHLLWLLGFPHVEKEEDQGVETKEEELVDSMMRGVGGGGSWRKKSGTAVKEVNKMKKEKKERQQ